MVLPIETATGNLVLATEVFHNAGIIYALTAAGGDPSIIARFSHERAEEVMRDMKNHFQSYRIETMISNQSGVSMREVHVHWYTIPAE